MLFAPVVAEVEQLERIVVAVIDQLEAVLGHHHVLLAVRHQVLFGRQKGRVFFGRLLGVDGRVREGFAAHQRHEADAGIGFWVIKPDPIQNRRPQIDRADVIADAARRRIRRVDDHRDARLFVVKLR